MMRGANKTLTVLSAAMILGLTGCGAGITKIKYIQHTSSTQLRLADNSVVSAPPGKHFMLYLISCVDNSTRDEGFFFTVERIRDNENQFSLVDSSYVARFTKLVGTGQTETGLGQVVLELSGPPQDVFENLNYAAHGSESVLMVNQTPMGQQFGPAFFLSSEIDLASSTTSPFLSESNLCQNSGSYH